MREFNTREAEGDYSITFETDGRKAFEQVQTLCRILIDGKDGDAIPIEWIKNYASHKASKDLIDCYWHFWEDDVLKMVADWEKENEQKDNDRLILKAWKKTTLTKEELEKAFEDNEFNEYMQMLINKEFEKRLKQKVQGYESRDTESIK